MLGSTLPGVTFITLAIFKALIKSITQTQSSDGGCSTSSETALAIHHYGHLLVKVRPPIRLAKQQQTTD